MALDVQRHRLLAKVARLYYKCDLTQDQVSKKVGLSRQKVQRMLQEAKKREIVKIGVCPVIGINLPLEHELAEAFGLREVVVVETTDYEDLAVVSQEIGWAAAEYLLRVVKPKDRIVISWGTALLGMVNSLFHLAEDEIEDVTVVQGLGGLVDPNHETHAAELARRLARELDGRAVLLPAPGAAGNEATRDAFYSDPHVAQAMAMAKSANLSFVSIGAPRRESILVKEGSIVTWSELAALKKMGAVGDINLRYFDKTGKLIDSDLNKRVIGLTLEELKETGLVVGVAGGKAKLKAISGALAGNLLDVLITDHITAQKLLQELG